MTDRDIAGLRAFLAEAAALKDHERNSWTRAGRRESVAEHSWRVALLALALRAADPATAAETDLGRVLALCLVHDLGEALGGDTPAVARPDRAAKSARERADLATLLAPAPPPVRAAVAALWEEHEAGETAEARLSRAADKFETVMQHVEGANPPGFDYGFNLGYGRDGTDAHPLAAALRALVDAETRARDEAGRVRDRGG